jgi:hypothetical protein
VAFLHIGKNAGTQIRYLSDLVNRAQRKKRIVHYGHALKLRDLPKSVPYFFSIRDPISRFKSAFYSRKRVKRRWKREEEMAFKFFEHANDLAEALFSGGEMGKRAFWAMKSIAHIKTDQCEWVQHSGDLFRQREPVFILRQENLEEDFKVLLKKMGLNTGWADLCIPPESQRMHSFDYSNVPELSKQARSNLEMWYKIDCEFYKYCVDWIQSNEG